MPHSFNHLLDIMALLRDEDRGCPWDKEQTFETIAPYTIEEAYEIREAIENKDYSELKSELGDLLLHAAYHSQIAKEKGLFTIDDVLKSICEKMIRRHPHVFADLNAEDAKNVTDIWEKKKSVERGEKKRTLDDVATSLPALMRAEKLQSRAARVGFDWPNLEPVYDKIEEEIAEVKDCAPDDKEALEDEMGDLIFACVNLARKLEIDPEEALRRANKKFQCRFEAVEDGIHGQGKKLNDASLDEMENEWIKAKKNGL